MASAKQNPAAKNEKTMMDGAAEDLPDFSTWTDHQIGFAPYWKAVNEGDWCYMRLVDVDMRDPNFTRYLCTAMKDTLCRRGPGNSDAASGRTGEEVLVRKGEAFSISVYYSLTDEFNFFLFARQEHDIDVPVKLTVKTKTKTKNLKEDGTPREVWNWRLQSDPANRPELEAHRDEWQKKLTAEKAAQQAESDRPQL